MIKVSLVEDDPDFQQLLASSLRSDPELELVGVYSSAEEFMIAYESAPCAVVVMDIHLPGTSGIECVREMKLKYPELIFNMCTVFEDDDRLFDSLKAGAVGYILKNKATDEIAESVKDVFRGGSPISPAIARKLVINFRSAQNKADVASATLSTLTSREKEILQLLSRGFRYKEIAAQLFISEETVRTHVHNLYEKLHVQSRTEAINKIFGLPNDRKTD
ncbi:response regulator transcription factor [Cryomorpha ignava]|nr:response regulator transcription factor [Cryomorpha ignava]